ncbi:MAG: B12-binding domain-containing radical SAM protein [Candidatus Micrarchaeota archaeon]|nr:B12-binding domain-containing radical SAM protein [Candidatus Micrarchaeota archaeon]
MKRDLKVLLVGAEEEENLSIRYLAAVLDEKGYHAEIAGCSDYKDFRGVIKTVKKSRPGLIGISIAFQRLASMFFELVSEIRKAGYEGHITVGGHFPTFEYRKILETQRGIDSVIRFEGEQPIVELAEFCEGKREITSVKNLVYRDSGRLRENPCICRFQDLDKLPFPVRDKKPQIRLGERFATLVSSRGCFHSRCLYCCIGAFHSKKAGSKYSLRSPDNVAREISELYHKRGVRIFQFHDDNFMLPSRDDNVKRLKEIRNALLREGVDPNDVAFLIKARPDSIDEEVASMLEEIGVVGIFLGIENASESGLKALTRGTNLDEIYNALNVLKNRFAVTYNLLIFHPTATLDEINENIYFIKNNLDCPFDFGRAEIVAGSPLERLVINEKLIRGEWPNWDYRIKDDAVQKMFEINLATFRRKGSNYSQLAHTLIALFYRAHVVNRIYPGKVSRNLLDKTKKLIEKSNRFILEKILGMYRLTAEAEPETEELFLSIRDGSKRLLSEAKSLSRAMHRLQILERKFKNMKLDFSPQESFIITKIFKL